MLLIISWNHLINKKIKDKKKTNEQNWGEKEIRDFVVKDNLNETLMDFDMNFTDEGRNIL